MKSGLKNVFQSRCPIGIRRQRSQDICLISIDSEGCPLISSSSELTSSNFPSIVYPSKQDADDPNPLVRALAIRTMGCLRAEKILDYLSDPLEKALKDENPYVRKTGAICVAKLFDLKPEMAIENGFVGRLQDMVGDSNPMVVANAVTALTDMHLAAIENDPNGNSSLFIIDSNVLSKLLNALNECTEWGRVAILNSLARYKSLDMEEAEHICERVVPQFGHANGSVVLGAVKVSLSKNTAFDSYRELSFFLSIECLILILTFRSFIPNQTIPGHHDSYATSHKTSFRSSIGQKDGTTFSNSSLFCTRSSMGSSEEYKPFITKETGNAFK